VNRYDGRFLGGRGRSSEFRTDDRLLKEALQCKKWGKGKFMTASLMFGGERRGLLPSGLPRCLRRAG